MNAEERQALREKHRICVEKEWHCDVIKLLNAWQGQTEQLLAIIHHDTTATTHAESVELMRRILTGTATEPVGETSPNVQDKLDQMCKAVTEIRASATSDVLLVNECNHHGVDSGGTDYYGMSNPPQESDWNFAYCPKCGVKL